MMELINKNNMAVCALQQGRPEKSLNLLSTALASTNDHFTKRQKILVQEFTMLPKAVTPLPMPPTRTITADTPSLCHIFLESTFGTEAGISDNKYDGARSLGVDMEEDEEPLVPSVLSVLASGVISSHNDGLVMNYNKALIVLHSLNDLDILTSVVLYSYRGARMSHGNR
jgi:hypothetical protein